jgi:ABC-type transporter Mla MlaB component
VSTKSDWEVIAMFRVSRAEEPSHTIVTIDGQLSSDTIEVVESCCDQAISIGKPVRLFLRDVSTVDRAGRALLCRLAAKGVRLLASGVYTSYLVRTLAPAGKGSLNSSPEEPTR